MDNKKESLLKKLLEIEEIEIKKDIVDLGIDLEIEEDGPIELFLDCVGFSSNGDLNVQLCFGFTDDRPLYRFTSASVKDDDNVADSIKECIDTLIRANNMSTGKNKRWDWDRPISVGCGHFPNDDVPEGPRSRVKEIAELVQKKCNDRPF